MLKFMIGIVCGALLFQPELFSTLELNTMVEHREVLAAIGLALLVFPWMREHFE